MNLTYKLKRLIYYYMYTPKGKFELSHIRSLFLFILICVIILEVMLYLWLNA